MKKVTSSHSKGQTVILSQEALDQASCVIDATGYKALDVVSVPWKARPVGRHDALMSA